LIRSSLRYALFFAAALTIGLLVSRRSSGPDSGVEATPFELALVDSNARFNLQGQRGTPILIEAFASWCPACRSSAPALAEAARAPRARAVHFLGVSMDDSSESARRAKTTWDIPYDVALDDGRFSKDYKITLLPTFVLIDAAGRVQRVSSGPPRPAELERWLSEVGAEKR
jgi:cytochrome c biogenesis protein CcmG/thiol:disulfide interchange protein DsbE